MVLWLRHFVDVLGPCREYPQFFELGSRVNDEEKIIFLNKNNNKPLVSFKNALEAKFNIFVFPCNIEGFIILQGHDEIIPPSHQVISKKISFQEECEFIAGLCVTFIKGRVVNCHEQVYVIRLEVLGRDVVEFGDSHHTHILKQSIDIILFPLTTLLVIQLDFSHPHYIFIEQV